MNSSGFDAVARSDARVLILGTLPGSRSLATREYYAQPRNVFWTIMEHVAGAGAKMPYEQRLARLVAHRLALWDVCASASRSGSLDSAIDTTSVRPNDFDVFFESHPELRLLCFNGAKAAALFERVVLPTLPPPAMAVRRVTLPSTSPANASMMLTAKIQAWRAALASVEA
jgi:hypoxanthine-DNA glycosylase